MAEGLTRVREIYQDRTHRVKELKAEGKKVIGYLCIYPILEMLTALFNPLQNIRGYKGINNQGRCLPAYSGLPFYS